MENRLGTNIYEPPAAVGGVDRVVVEQEYRSTDTLWSPIASIVFTTSLIPVFPEQTGVPLILENGNITQGLAAQSAFSPIITDISLPLSGASDYRQFIEYAPTAEYRLASMTDSKQDLRSIDLQVYWKNR